MARFLPLSRTLRLGAALGAALWLTAASQATAEPQGTLSTRLAISKVRSAQGNVFVAVYDRSGWLVPGKFKTYRTVRARTGELTVTIPGLSRGRYAVAVFHDENKNGVVDTNWLGLPKEGFGFSRLSPLRVPSFDEASFEAGTQVVPVQLRY
ncbi:MAG: hypothetical protein B6A08_01375 [Sorangiineae bacterium NIC37A_2]|nr:MAG: hypothetical protein B6A08_01375 [Sorangiineae bacterium NIC37A_2]